jgi:uncharacterized protein YbjT (DUF2867 family)
MTILLTGGTGALGRLVLPLLHEHDRDVRVLSRRPHGPGSVVGDLATGAGLDAAVTGADTILHCAGNAKGDEEMARHLVRAALRAGRPHVVSISVVGADRVPVVSRADRAMFGYFAAKRAAEQVVAGSGLPWTTLRATQFFSLTLTVVAQLAKLPVVPVAAGVRFQPVDGGEVAHRLVELALGRPAGLVDDLGGPRVLAMGELVRAYLRATGRRRPIVAVRFGGQAYRAVRAGANLAPEQAVGRRTWDDFLAATR